MPERKGSGIVVGYPLPCTYSGRMGIMSIHRRKLRLVVSHKAQLIVVEGGHLALEHGLGGHGQGPGDLALGLGGGVEDLVEEGIPHLALKHKPRLEDEVELSMPPILCDMLRHLNT